MKPEEFKERADRSLSALTWAEKDRQCVLDALDKEAPKVKKVTTSFILIAAIVLISATALAGGLLTGFYRNVFGTGVKGQPEYTEEIKDEDGNVVKTEPHPLMERVDVDEELADALTGPYIWSPDRSVTLGDYTVTLENALFDKNGIGVLQMRIANPNGHGLKRSWAEYGSDESLPLTVSVQRSEAEYPLLDDAAYVVEDTFTETEMEYVIYLTPMEKWTADEKLTVCVDRFMGSEEAGYEVAMIPLDLEALVPARAFAGNGLRAEVSPLGLSLTFENRPEGEVITERMTIRYADGSAFTVLDDHTVNLSLSSADWETQDQWMAFNRLVNADQITEIEIVTSEGSSVLLPAE